MKKVSSELKFRASSEGLESDCASRAMLEFAASSSSSARNGAMRTWPQVNPALYS